MKYKSLLSVFLGLLLILTAAIPAGAEEEQAESTQGEILVIYPLEADRHFSDDSLSAIAQVLLSLRYTADFVEAEKAAEMLPHYENVIWCALSGSSRMDPALLSRHSGKVMVLGQASGMEKFGLLSPGEDRQEMLAVAEYVFSDAYSFQASVRTLSPGTLPDADYTRGTLETRDGLFPLACGREDFHYIALADYTADFAKAVLTQEIAQWLWPYTSRMHVYTQQLVLDSVYPFTDPDRLSAFVHYMAELRMNYVISVMPIYQNEDYPAMQQFCEVLRYAQANGGSVILHAPVTQNTLRAEELEDRLTVATCNYFSHGVYPLALEIPSEWLFREDLYGIIGCYRTIFLSEMDAFSSHTVKEYNLGRYLRLGIQQISPALCLEDNALSHIAQYSAMVSVDPGVTEDESIYAVIDAIRDSPIPMQSLWDMEEAVYLNDSHYLRWDKNTLIVDGEVRTNQYEPVPYDNNHQYQRNAYFRFVANLSRQNHFLIALSVLELVVFILLGVRSRKQMHGRFLRKKEPETSERN